MQKVKNISDDLLRRIDIALRGFTALERPFVEPCMDTLETLESMPDSVELRPDLRKVAESLLQGAIRDESAFISEMRKLLTRHINSAVAKRSRDAVNCEIVFEEKLVHHGLEQQPDLARHIKGLEYVAKEKKDALKRLVVLYGVERVGNKVSFDPYELTIAAKRRLVELIESSQPSNSAPQPRTLPMKNASSVVEKPIETDDDNELFTAVMGNNAVRQPVEADRPVLAQNPHHLENMIADVSPVGSPSLSYEG